jgi:hypothetical protein
MVTDNRESSGPDSACSETDAPVQTHNEAHQPVLIDVEVPPPRAVRWRFVLLVVIVAFPAGCIATVIAGVLGRPNLGPIALAGFPLLIFAIHWGVRSRKAKAAACQLNPSNLPVALKTTLSSKNHADSCSFLGALVNRLVSAGKVGHVIRFCSPDRLFPVAPVTVPFEPRLLEDTIAEDFDSSEGKGTSQAGQAVGPARFSPERARSRWTRLIIPIGAACLMLWGSIQSVIASGTVPRFPVLTLVVVGAMLGLAWWGRRFPNPQVFLVPGGLVVRRSPWYRRRWSLHVYDCRCSVLIARQLRNQVWRLRVGDSEAQEAIVATEVQTTQALRAWLSPLAPPTLEQLSDLR